MRLDEPSVSMAEVSRSLRAEPDYSVSRLRVSVKGDARCTSHWAVMSCFPELLSTPVRGKAKTYFPRRNASAWFFVLPLTRKCHQDPLKQQPAQQARCDVASSTGLVGVLSSCSDFLLSSQSNWSWWFVNKTRIQILTLTDSLLLKKILHLWLLR